MSIVKKMSCFIIWIMLIGTSYAQIRTLDYPKETEKVFNTPLESTWHGVLEVVKITNGNIITQDKASGLIVYSISDGKTKIYINVYLRIQPGINTTLVNLTSRAQHEFYMHTTYIPTPVIEESVFEKRSEKEREFFEKLEKILR